MNQSDSMSNPDLWIMLTPWGLYNETSCLWSAWMVTKPQGRKFSSYVSKHNKAILKARLCQMRELSCERGGVHSDFSICSQGHVLGHK